MKISSDHYGMDQETNTDQGQDTEKKVKLLIKMPDLCVLKVVILRKCANQYPSWNCNKLKNIEDYVGNSIDNINHRLLSLMS